MSDPVAAGLVENLTAVQTQITGAIDSPMIHEIQTLIKELVPKAKVLGAVYNPGEANSTKALADLKASLDPSLKLLESAVNSSNLVADGLRSIVKKVDALYIPLDNTVVSALPKFIQIANAHKIPTFSSDPQHVTQGVFASYGYSQFAVGQTAGAKAAKILNGAKVSSLPISTPFALEASINKRTAKLLNIAVPSQFNKIAVKMID